MLTSCLLAVCDGPSAADWACGESLAAFPWRMKFFRLSRTGMETSGRVDELARLVLPKATRSLSLVRSVVVREKAMSDDIASCMWSRQDTNTKLDPAVAFWLTTVLVLEGAWRTREEGAIRVQVL